jgi:NAD(P)-dependent dehydrogenase (short-subunit alcohol dehydrogenase family)
MQNRYDLSGKNAIVTGGTRGLGNAMARGLAEAGANVIITGRKQDACEAAAADLASKTGRKVVGTACHMGEWDRIDALVDRAGVELGSIDILVNNAGINPVLMPVADITEEYLDKLLAVNFKGPVRLAQKIAPQMIANGGGSIINVVTIGAYNGGPGIGPYSASKAALLNMTRVMAWEWAEQKVRVNAIAPGPFDTDMMRGAEAIIPGFSEGAAAGTLQKRVADPDEIIGLIVYLAGDASSYVTGSDFKIAGGMLT